MSENNFKRLEREQAERFRENTDRVNKSIKSNLKAFGFFGEIIELYVTKAIGFLSNVSGGNEPKQKTDKKYPNV